MTPTDLQRLVDLGGIVERLETGEIVGRMNANEVKRKIKSPWQFKVNTETNCWEWQRAKANGGYGVCGTSTERMAHRIYYTALRGPIKVGLTLDHLCRVTACVNPAHLEQVTMAENLRRGYSPVGLNAMKTHCDKGHPLNGANLMSRCDGRRRCRACYNAWQRANYEKNGRQYARS